MYVAVAQTGAKVRWHGEGELIELKPAKIRGVESNGMICGADEIGLAERFPKKSEKEIVDLGSLKVRAGEPLAKVLNLSDAIFEIDNKSLSNRPDLWGHYGLAREVAALTGRPLQPYKTTEIKKGKGVDLKIKNTDTKACPRYMAVALSGVVVAPSPRWLEEVRGETQSAHRYLGKTALHCGRSFYFLIASFATSLTASTFSTVAFFSAKENICTAT
jgi:phenylalanyl-tRNA synthetase beta chain